MREHLLIVSNFLRNPRQIGAILPSSRFLSKEIMKHVPFKNAKVIVELGPGGGVFTKSILKKARPDTRVVSLELNKRCYLQLKKKMRDKRLLLAHENANNLCEYLSKKGIATVDCVVSGLPFRNFSQNERKKILTQVKKCVRKNGLFILFQYTPILSKTLKTYFTKVERKYVFLNVPPAYVYVCKK